MVFLNKIKLFEDSKGKSEEFPSYFTGKVPSIIENLEGSGLIYV